MALEPPRTPKKIEYALDEITTGFVEVHDYLDLEKFDSHVKELEVMIQLAETAKEDDTCKECGELRDDCLCSDEDETEADDDEDDEDASGKEASA